MDYRYAFEILGIGETQDEEAIKAAYRAVLSGCNPEDEPERFMQLREAYETAVDYAKKSAYEENMESDDAKQFIDAVADIYTDFTKRLDVSEWEKVLDSEFCVSLETADIAREKLLVYFMQHFRLPYNVWQVVDRTFNIVENREELNKLFPRDYMDFVIKRISVDDRFSYDKIEIVDALKNTDVDSYIDALFALETNTTNIEWGVQYGVEQLEADMAQLDEYGVRHPYHEVERLYIYTIKGDLEAASKIVESVTDHADGDEYVSYAIASYYWKAENYEEACVYYHKALDSYPDHYLTRLHLAEYEYMNERYYECREMLEALAEINANEPKAGDLLMKSNEEYIKLLTYEYENGIEDEHFKGEKLPIELAWCLFQNNQDEKCIEVLENMDPGEETIYSYHNLFGRVLCSNDRFEEGLPHLVEWNKILDSTKDDGTDEMKRRLTRRSFAAGMLGSCQYELGMHEDAFASFEKSIALAGDVQEKLNAMYQMAGALFDTKAYEKCLEKCDEIINLDARYYAGYVLRQKTFYELRMGQGVIDDYYNATNVYPGHYLPYYYAAEMFFQVAQDEDCKAVLDRARENNVEFSARMKLLDVKLRRILADEEKDPKVFEALLAELDEIEALKGTETFDIEDPAEINFIKGLVYWNLAALDNTEENRNLVKKHIGMYINESPEALNGYTSYCDFIMHPSRRDKENKYLDEAEKYYNMGLEKIGRAVPLVYGIGMVNYLRKNNEEAVKYFEEVLEQRDTYKSACMIVKDYYEDLYLDKHNPEDLKKAIDVATRQLNVDPSCYYYVERGLLYMRAYMLDEAIEDFNKAVECEPDGWSAYNNLGCCYKYKAEYEKAIEYFEKANELIKKQGDKSPKPYNNMADCYEAMGEFLKANECYKKNMEEMDYKESDANSSMAENYRYAGAFDKSIEAAEIGMDDYEKVENLCEIEMIKGDMDKAIELAKEAVERFKGTDFYANALSNMANVYSMTGENYDLTYEYYKKCIEEATDKKSYTFLRNKYCSLVLNCLFSDMVPEEKYIEKIKEYVKKFEEDLDNTLNFLPNRPSNLAVYAELLMCLGEYDRALELLEQMDQCNKCKFCTHKGCFEKSLYIGNIYFIKKDYVNAKRMYEEAMRLSDNAQNVRPIIKFFEKKIAEEQE